MTWLGEHLIVRAHNAGGWSPWGVGGVDVRGVRSRLCGSVLLALLDYAWQPPLAGWVFSFLASASGRGPESLAIPFGRFASSR
jgi:hypothetical protein